jgi:hypothetical protein
MRRGKEAMLRDLYEYDTCDSTCPKLWFVFEEDLQISANGQDKKKARGKFNLMVFCKGFSSSNWPSIQSQTYIAMVTALTRC